MSHVAHMHESWHIYAWVMLQVWISDTTDRHESTMAASGDVQRQLKHVLCLSGQKTQHMLHLSLPSLRKRVGTSLVYTGEGLFWRIRTHHYRRHKTPKTQDTWRIDRQGWGRQQRMSLRFLCLGCLCETYTLFMCVYVSLDQETYTCLVDQRVSMSLCTCLSLSLRDNTCLQHNCFNNDSFDNRFR